METKLANCEFACNQATNELSRKSEDSSTSTVYSIDTVENEMNETPTNEKTGIKREEISRLKTNE